MSRIHPTDEDSDHESFVDHLETAYRNRDLTFFDTIPDEELNEHDAFLRQLAKRNWDAALVLPRVQSCPNWPRVIRNQFILYQNEEDHSQVAEYLFSYCPESHRRSTITRLYRHYRSAGVTNPPDITAFVEAHREHLDTSPGNLADSALRVPIRIEATTSKV